MENRIENKIESFLKKLDLKYVDITNYISAFTHKTYLNENFDLFESNQRLEFLGDAVLGQHISNYVYRNFILNEGGMTDKKKEFVSNDYLHQIGKELEIEPLIRIGNSIDRTNLQNKIYSDVVESLIGALYLDGLGEHKKFIDKFILKLK